MSSDIRDLAGARPGQVVQAMPNTNVLYPRTAIPVLDGHHEPGEHWLACAVFGATAAAWDRDWPHPPGLDQVGAARPGVPAAWLGTSTPHAGEPR